MMELRKRDEKHIYALNIQTETIIQAGFWQQHFQLLPKIQDKRSILLFKEEKQSVSDLGYKLGINNLSHFLRALKEHIR